MKENNMINRALGHTHVPQLPSDFNNKVMARIDMRARQREILAEVGMWLMYIVSITAFLGAGGYITSKYFTFDFNKIFDYRPQFEIPSLELDYLAEAISTWGWTAILMLSLLLADSYIRHRILIRKIK